MKGIDTKKTFRLNRPAGIYLLTIVRYCTIIEYETYNGTSKTIIMMSLCGYTEIKPAGIIFRLMILPVFRIAHKSVSLL